MNRLLPKGLLFCSLFLLLPISVLAQDRLAGRAVAVTLPGTAIDRAWHRVNLRLADNPLVTMFYFTRGERGGEGQLLHDLRRGRAHMASLSLRRLAASVPELELVLLPRLFNSRAEARYVYSNYLFYLAADMLAHKGLRLLAWVDSGRRNPDAIVVNRLWFDAATASQQAELRRVWDDLGMASVMAAQPAEQSLIAPLRADPGRAASGAMRSGGGHAAEGRAVEQFVARTGGRSAEVYAAILRGKRAYADRQVLDSHR